MGCRNDDKTNVTNHYRSNFSRCRRKRNWRTPQRDLTFTICESDTTGVNVSPSNCTTATLTVNVVGQIIANDDTLGTPAPLASGTTPVAAGSVIGHLKRSCRNDDKHECYPITTGNFSRCRRNVTIAANTRDLTRLPIYHL
jgi:hypothetical protein